MYDPTTMYDNEIEITITFGIGDNPNVVFTYCGDDPNAEDGEWEDEDGNPITPTSEMIAYIEQQLWVQHTIGWVEPRSVLIDGVFVTYTLEISKGVAMWQFHSISATDWEGDYAGETLDLSALSQEQMRKIHNKADQQFGERFVDYYPQWKDYKHIDLVDSEIN